MRKAGVSNIVFTDETVCVMPRSEAPPIIDEQLQNAGPVPFYVCMIQDFMNGGSLEGLAEDGRMTPAMMFKGLENVASTLAGMHKNNVQHKDIKPENILLDMQGDTLVAAKLADFGSATFGDVPAGRADDTRRFGVTIFSLATGEGWTKNRLIREKHDALVARLTDAVGSSSDAQLRRLPEVLGKILDGSMQMAQVAAVMAELKAAY